MIEANKAYARGDEAQLRWILDAWERSPESVQGIDAEATRLRLVRRIAQVEEQLQLLDGDLAALKATPLWELKAMVDQAAVRGKDIVQGHGAPAAARHHGRDEPPRRDETAADESGVKGTREKGTREQEIKRDRGTRDKERAARGPRRCRRLLAAKLLDADGENRDEFGEL